jgi:hypothetical protein
MRLPEWLNMYPAAGKNAMTFRLFGSIRLAGRSGNATARYTARNPIQEIS